MHLILASTSRYRAALLERLGLHFAAEAPEVDETPLPGEAPVALVERLSLAKANAVAARHEDALVIGSDQLASLDGEILGKPGTEARAMEQLSALSGRTVTFLTGLALVNSASGSHSCLHVATPVRFRKLTPAMIEDYVRREQPLDCAGAFKSEGLGIALFESIGGEDPSALIGLPLMSLCSLLAAEGLPVLGPQAGGRRRG
jgi:septum formation protein